MSDEKDRPVEGFGGVLSRLSLPLLGLVGITLLLGVGAGGYYAYETYDFVQHDNDFCMSCHLMTDPYEQFGQSAHRGLGCKACHQPTLVARTAMALTQVIENPEEISVHAEVPNERCAECHIEGDPQKWRMIANSAGHRVHMESEDPILEGLQCVECHATSVHQFAPVDRTCAQSGCHEDNTIQLGGMEDLTIHCVACHSFVAPVVVAEGERASQASLDAAILPDRQECLSCHVMRVMMSMPVPDPHGGVCASCHNPHDQATPAEAVQSCTNAGCHVGTDTLTSFHRGLQPGTLEDCMGCHTAHDFSLDGDDCASCHPDLMDEGLTMPRTMPGTEPRDTVPGELDASGFAMHDAPVNPYLHVTGVGVGLWQPPVQQERPSFAHATHRTVECTSCHSNSDRHGGLLVRTLNDCRSCHHSEPLAQSCERCHDAADMPASPIERQLQVDFSVNDVTQRTVSFPHGNHEVLGCAFCHAEGLQRSAAEVDCMMCHQTHDAENDCTMCHVSPPTSAHPPSEAHVTCSGAGCHVALPFQSVPRTRQACLGCHQDKKDHRPDRRCVECHTLPDPRGED